MKKGFSLVELILTIVILAVAVSGTLTILAGMGRQSGEAARQTLAIEYGRMRMEGILSKRFDQSIGDLTTCSFTPPGSLGPDVGETENTYNDVDDFITPFFDGEIDATDPLAGRGFRTNVEVLYVTPSENTPGFNYMVASAASSCYKRITVEVVETATGQSLARFRTTVTPYK